MDEIEEMNMRQRQIEVLEKIEKKLEDIEQALYSIASAIDEKED